jgi:hypothetical protein
MESHVGGRGAVQYPENPMTACFNVLMNAGIIQYLEIGHYCLFPCLQVNAGIVQYHLEIDLDCLFPTPHILTIQGHLISSDTNKPLQLMLNSLRIN